MTTALVLIDLQNDFLETAGLQPSAGEVVTAAARLLDHFRARGAPVIHVRTSVDRASDRRMPHWKRAGRWRCEVGTPGHDPPPGLVALEDEPVVDKTGFSPFVTGQLGPRLAALGVDGLVLAGVHLHACVRSTALGAHQLGYRVVVASDAVGSDDTLHAASTRRYLEERAVAFLSVDAIVTGDRDGAPASDGPLNVEATCEAAAAAQARWRRFELAERARLLLGLAGELERSRDGLSDLLANDVSKPVRDGRGEVDFAVALTRAAVAQAERSLADAVVGRARAERVAHGVVALITPFNNPVGIPVGKLVPALLWGNAVVWKPAPAGHSAAVAVLELLQRLGLPEGLVGLLAGGAQTAVALMAHDSVRAVTVSGGLALGQAARDVCGRRAIPLQAELGGNNGAVIWTDADLDEAARQIARGAFGYAGQRCTANRRVIVASQVFAEFLARFERAIAALQLGDPGDETVDVGPMVSTAARRRAEGFVTRARSDGHSVRVPHAAAATGERLPALLAPHVVLCDDPAHEIVQSETFAPIVVLQRAEDWDHALTLLNGVVYGLVASLFSASEARWAAFREAALAGILKWNAATAGVSPELPFGGWKASGIGPPEHGSGDRAFFTRVRTIYE